MTICSAVLMFVVVPQSYQIVSSSTNVWHEYSICCTQVLVQLFGMGVVVEQSRLASFDTLLSSINSNQKVLCLALAKLGTVSAGRCCLHYTRLYIKAMGCH